MSLIGAILRLLLQRPRQRPRMPFDEPRRSDRPGDGELDGGGVTVEPDRPLGLSGGAAAPLEFDE